MATVDPLQKPDNVNPKFKTKKKAELSHYKIMQLEAKTREGIAAYVTQEEVFKETGR